ncbi:MAG: ABC transporter permease [Nitrospinota bacterium]
MAEERETMVYAGGRVVRSQAWRSFFRLRRTTKVTSFFALVFIWWLISLMYGEEVFPNPFLVSQVIVEDLFAGSGPGGHTSGYHIGVSLIRILAAFTVAMVAGFGLGVLMGVSRYFENFLDNWVMVGLTIPGLCWALIALMWFGIRDESAIFAIVMVTLPFVVVNVWEGTKAVDRQLLDMARAFRANRKLTIRKVLFPQLIPYVFAAIRYTFSVGWKIAVVSEVFGLSSGVGFMLNYWFGMFRMDKVLAYTAVFTLIMIFVESYIIKPAQAKALRWRAEITL